MNPSHETHAGSCLCGATRFCVRGPLGGMSHCHCTDCRKAHSAAFATFVTVRRECVTWIAGGDRLGKHTAESRAIRSFCRGCGSLITWERPGAAEIDVAAALFDTPIEARAKDHLFVRSKVAWYDIQDGLPQYKANRPKPG